MNEQEKLKAKIEQNLTDQSKLLDEQDKLQLKLKEFEEPKDRLGDYGYWLSNYGNEPRLATKKKRGGAELYLINTDGHLCSLIFYTNIHVKTGNIFDDLKRNSEDLEEFEVSDEAGILAFGAFRQYDNSCAFLKIVENSEGYFTSDQLIGIGQQLIQMAHTIKRKQP